MVRSRHFATALLLLASPLSATAWDFDLRVDAEARHFYHQEVDETSWSLAAQPSFLVDWNRRRDRVEGEFFYRYDDTDDRRTHGDVRSLYYQHIARDWEASIGLRRVFWGVTESRHLVDIINQSDLVEDLDAEQKLGQPMVMLALIRDIGTFEFFVMPYQRARTFPGPDGHPRLPFAVATEQARYESDRGQEHVDFAARWRTRRGGLDFNLSLFDGTAREPDVLPCLRQGSGFNGTDTGPNCDLVAAATPPERPLRDLLLDVLQQLGLAPDDEQLEAEFLAEIMPQILANLQLVPDYARLRQIGIDTQYITGGWALKLEALLREQRGERSFASVAGFEYTFSDVGGFGWDVGALAEYLYDEQDTLLSTRADDDVFLGLRVGLNDIASTQLLAGFFFDRDSGKDHLLQIEASRRIGANWRAALKARHFEQVPGDALTGFLDDEDMLSLTLERYF